MKGIGLCLARYLLRNDPQLKVIATSRSPNETRTAILAEQDQNVSDRLRVLEIDVTKEETIQLARRQVEDEFGKGAIKCIFNVSGIVFDPFILLTCVVVSREDCDKGVLQ
jgi:NAD(P)-dependent dehydrogenase (short-subunit alcohol dehydrogenase family)